MVTVKVRIVLIFIFCAFAFAANAEDLQSAVPERGAIWRETVTGMEFVWVAGGCFLMGCGWWTNECSHEEQPVHEVCVDGFWLGKYEVTQRHWQWVMGSSPAHFKKGLTFPVEQVTWNGAKEFIRRLNQQNDGKFRLPTEAEWEYACRGGGKPEKYAGGDQLDLFGWFAGNSDTRAHEVGTKEANGLGIHDMSGNVWEWCEDMYSFDAYRKHRRNNPQYTADGTGRVIRGGSWLHGPRYARCAYRYRSNPEERASSLGFRLARTARPDVGATPNLRVSTHDSPDFSQW